MLKLFKDAPIVLYRNGSTIKRTNIDNDETIYCVKSGFIKSYTISDDGGEHIQMLVGRNEVFPIFSLAYGNESDSIQHVFFEAVGSVKLLVMIKSEVLLKIRNDSAVANAMLRHLAERYLISGDHIENLSYKSAYERLVYCLRFLAVRYGRKNGDAVYFDSVFTHRLIGSLTNLTRGTVTKEFDKLRVNKLASNDKQRIFIPSLGKLSKEIEYNNNHLLKAMHNW